MDRKMGTYFEMGTAGGAFVRLKFGFSSLRRTFEGAWTLTKIFRV